MEGFLPSLFLVILDIMDEIPLKVIFWIILGLIYLFTRGKKKAPVAPSTPEEPQEPESSRPMTFEELLREIEGMKKKEEPQAPVSPVPDYAMPETPSFKKVEKPLEDVSYDYRDQDKIYQVYEDAKQQAFARPSLEETLKLEDTIVRFKQFKGYEKSALSRQSEEIFRDLKTPQSFRKAFIISEILKPKF